MGEGECPVDVCGLTITNADRTGDAMRRIALAAAVLGALASTGCSATGTGAPTPSSVATNTTSPQPSSSTANAAIPAAALLQAADLEGVEPKPAGEDVGKDLRPP